MKERLSADDFSVFFRELYGYEPFPWQDRLTKEVCVPEGAFPALLDLPTGSGKTACIDIAVFHLAYSLASQARRVAPLRIVWVVDRRLIVDEAFDRARSLAEKLEKAETGVLRRIADILNRISGEGFTPLLVQRLRGGMPREGDWVRTPTQPTIICSTVDQIGSRLLFRGYGVTESMRPLHAGLLGDDALIVLDEVHLSEPFRQTTERIAAYDRPLGNPWKVIQLSATPRTNAGSKSSFCLDDSDRCDPRLGRRLVAEKPAQLISLGKVTFGSWDHADRFALEALAHVDKIGVTANVLVVVNRVELARRVHERIEQQLRENGRSGSVLVTRLVGRGREVEKEKIRQEIITRCKSDPTGRSIKDRSIPYIVVATQAVEAGADLDFDALVTQIASIDALRQRFGRLNRMGRPIVALASILATDAEIAQKAKDDPIYGGALRETWHFLEERIASSGGDVVDFSSSALDMGRNGGCERLCSPAPDAPVLMPEHVVAFSRTSPPPAWSPDPSLFLHGAPTSPADVNVVWRADLDKNLNDDGVVAQILALVPPRSAEVVALPIGLVRRWLNGETGDAADVEKEAFVEDERDIKPKELRFAWNWRGSDGVKRVSSKGIQPGETLVVPSAYGGCDEYGWNPQSLTVLDVALEASLPYAHHFFAVRLHRALLDQIPSDDADYQWRRISACLEDYRDDPRKSGELLEKLIEVVPDGWKKNLRALRKRRRGRLKIEWPYTPGGEQSSADGVILVAPFGLEKEALQELGNNLLDIPIRESATESDVLGARSRARKEEGQVSLSMHSYEVREWARSFAGRLEFSPQLVFDITLAAYLHDIGKADARFQRYLIGNFWIGTGKVLAKSLRRRTANDDAEARVVAQLPNNWRHEALSVRMARVHRNFIEANDPELVLWLIGTHHGFGRPSFPHEDPEDERYQSYTGFEPYDRDELRIPPSSGPQRLDFQFEVLSADGPMRIDWPTMFVRLQARYGIWGLARLEAIVRLADHRASESRLPVPKSEVSA
jgi:CRISPR-associated endonuclease/helicase Cas3